MTATDDADLYASALMRMGSIKLCNHKNWRKFYFRHLVNGTYIRSSADFCLIREDALSVSDRCSLLSGSVPDH